MQIAIEIFFVWIMMVVAAPVAEEILYRGFFYRGLRATRLGVAGTILVTSVAFGLLHKVGGFGWDRVVVDDLSRSAAGLAAPAHWRPDGPDHDPHGHQYPRLDHGDGRNPDDGVVRGSAASRDRLRSP